MTQRVLSCTHLPKQEPKPGVHQTKCKLLGCYSGLVNGCVGPKFRSQGAGSNPLLFKQLQPKDLYDLILLSDDSTNGSNMYTSLAANICSNIFGNDRSREHLEFRRH